MPSIPQRRSALPASAPLARTLLALAALHALAGCTAVSNTFGSNKVDYRAQAQPASTLDVPPDLTQLSNDPRYQPPTGATISANALQASGTPATAVSAQGVAPRSTDTLRLERVGDQRWLISSQTPEQLWPQLLEFWRLNGFVLVTDQPEVGLMETDWLENRAKLPRDALSRLVGKVFDPLSDSGERDRYRLLVERGRQGSEITITHQGASQVVLSDRSTATEQVRWQSRPSDPSLEAEMLARLMVVLNGPVPTSPEAIRSAVDEAGKQVAATPVSPARARLDERAGTPTLQVDEGFDRAWRRVGLALDRGGFTVEDRDRSQGLYFVRYVDPKLAGKEDPGFFARLFGAKKQDLSGQRYRVKVAAEGQGASTVAVLDAEGGRPADDSARNIAQLLLNELR